jgi:hypothetical protein
MMQETKTSEPNKFPVASAPQKTYTYTLKGRFGVAIAVVLMVFIMSLFIMLNLLGSWLGLLVPLFLLPLPVFFSVTMHRQKNGFITIAPDGLTFGGALNFKEGFKRDFSQKDFDKVSHFGWEQIQSVGFTRDLAHPSFLFVELTDGETYYFPLFYFRNDFVVVDKVRRFTGYSGCKDLGRYILYVKQLRAKDAN